MRCFPHVADLLVEMLEVPHFKQTGKRSENDQAPCFAEGSEVLFLILEGCLLGVFETNTGGSKNEEPFEKCKEIRSIEQLCDISGITSWLRAFFKRFFKIVTFTIFFIIVTITFLATMVVTALSMMTTMASFQVTTFSMVKLLIVRPVRVIPSVVKLLLILRILVVKAIMLSSLLLSHFIWILMESRSFIKPATMVASELWWWTRKIWRSNNKWHN